MSYVCPFTSKKSEFKSFNTNYLNWLFSIEGAEKLYSNFINSKGEEIIQSLIKKYDLKGSADTNDDIHQLDFYIKNLLDIYQPKKSCEKEERTMSMDCTTDIDSQKPSKPLSPISTLLNSSIVSLAEVYNNTEFIFTFNPLYGKEQNNSIIISEN